MEENKKVVIEKATPAMQKLEFNKTIIGIIGLILSIVVRLIIDLFSNSVDFSHYEATIYLVIIFIFIALYFYCTSKKTE